VAERDSLPLHRDARQASIDVGLEGVHLGGMGLSQGPGLARRVLLEGKDPVPHGLRMGRDWGNKPDGQRDGGDGRASAAVPLEELGDQSLSS
jgi:hypothetical protein